MALLLVLCFSAPAARAQCTLGGTASSWTGSTGVWNNGSDWSAGIPNSPTTSACITNGTAGTPSAVTLNIDATVADLQLGGFDSLATDLNRVLTITGGQIINDGQIAINGGGGANSFLVIDSLNVTLSGGGTLTLNTVGGGGTAYIGQAAGGLTLTNQSTIQGAGIIGTNGLALINSGIVDANSPGQALLLMNVGGLANTGLLESTSGGILQLQGVQVANGGGNITANGGTVQLLGNTIVQGGTLNALNGGTLGTPQNSVAYLDGSTGAGAVTINGTYTSDLNTHTYLLGTITNKNNIQLNGGNGTNSELLIDSGNVTLQGGGTLTLATATGGGNAFVDQAAGGLTLTNVNNTIQGSGILGQNGLTLVNESGGIINANSTGGPLINTLTVQGATVTNAGLMEATNSGVLQINGVIVNNAGGNITANGAGASVQLFGSGDIQGGTLSNNGGAFFGTPQGQTVYLDGATYGPLTINGTYTSDLSTSTYILGTVNNKNNFQLNGGNNTNSSLLIDSSNVMLQGGGTLTLATATGGGAAYVQQAAGGLTLTNVNNTIQGSGVIGANGLTLVNQSSGTVNANGTPTSVLLFQSGAVVNQGLMEATGSGVLQIIGDTVNNFGGLITANGAGASVQLFGSAVIQGGTLTNNGGAFFGTPQGGTAFLDGTTQGPLTLNGTYTSDLNTATYIYGTIHNNNNFQLNGGAGTNSELRVGNNVTLQGGGTVTLATATGGGNAFLDQAAGGLTLTNVDNAIQGSGIIGQNGLTLVNQAGGVINANSAGGSLINTLTIQSAAVINPGLMEATNNGVLQINGVVVNNAGGTIAANGAGASVQLFGSADIQGGTLSNNGGAFFGTPAGDTAVLDGSTGAGAVTLNGPYTGDYNTHTYLLGTITNTGNIQVNGGNGYNTEILINSSSLKLQGGGAVTMSTAAGGGNAFIYQAAGGLTLENVDNGIRGAGIIGQNGLSIINDAAGNITANVPGQNLYINGGGNVTNNGGLFAVLPGSALVLQNVNFTNYAANTLTGGAYAINGTSGSAGTLQIGSLGNTGGEIVNNAATIVLNGPNSNFVDGASLNALSNFSVNTGAGVFTITNGRNFSSPGNFANAGAVTVGNNSTLTIGSGSNSYSQSGGMTQGIGMIAGTVNINGGVFQPGLGDSPGTLTIQGIYNQSGGTFNELMAGAGAGQFGVLNVPGGNITLGAGAELNIILLAGYDPVGNTFTIMTAAGGLISGTFANAPASGFQMDGVNWTIAYSGGNIVLDAVSLVGGLVNATWNSSSGNWTTAAQWSCTPGPSTCVPNNNASNVYAAVLNSPGNTLTLDGTSTPTSITVDNLTLTAGTLKIGAGASLNGLNNGLTDINANSGLVLAGTFTHGSESALAGLTSVEGSLTLQGQTLTTTPAGGTFANSGTMNLQKTTALTLSGDLNNSGTIWTGNTMSDTGNNSLTVSGALANSWHIYMEGTGDSLSAADVTNSGFGSDIQLLGTNQTLTSAGDFTNNAGSYLELGGNGNHVAVGGNLMNNGYVEMLGTNGSVVVNGQIVVATGALVQVGGALGTGNVLSSSGDFINGTGGSLYLVNNNNSVNVGGTFTNSSGSTTEFDGANDSLTVAGALNNAGTMTLSAASDGLTSGSMSNTGTINLNGNNETLTVTGDFNNNSLGTALNYNRNGGALFFNGNSDTVTVAGNLTNNHNTWLWMDGTNNSIAVTGALANNGGLIVINDATNKLTMGTWSNLDSSGNLTGGGGYEVVGVLQYAAPANGINNIASGVEISLFGPGALITPDGTTDALAGLSANAGYIAFYGHNETITPMGGTLANSGRLDVVNGSAVGVSGKFSNSGLLLLADNGSNLTAAQGLDNSGSIQNSASGLSLIAQGDFNNNGGYLWVTGDSNSVSVTGAFNNSTNGVVDMSPWSGVGGTNGTITVAGLFTNHGTVGLEGSGNTLVANGGFSNADSVTVGAGNALTAMGASGYSQIAGTTKVDGTLTASSANISGGLFQGTGTVNGNVNVSGTGTIKGGDSPGTLTINGNYNQSGGTLLAELAGLNPGADYSQLLVNGMATLGGTLDLDEISGFQAGLGEDFYLMWTLPGGLSGEFAMLDFSDAPLPYGDYWSVVYGSNYVELEVKGSGPAPTPEPSSWMLFATLLSAIAAYRMMRKSPKPGV